MALIKNNVLPMSVYNEVPFVDKMEHAGEDHTHDFTVLTGLLQKYCLPANVYVKLLHIPFHYNEGEVVAFSEVDASPFGWIPFSAPFEPGAGTEWRGCHYMVDAIGNLQAFEYTRDANCLDIAAFPAFVAEFCHTVLSRNLQEKFGLGIISGVAEHGLWGELYYPETYATFPLPNDFVIPKDDRLTSRTTKTQFGNPMYHETAAAYTYQHQKVTYKSGEGDEPVVDGVLTKDGFARTVTKDGLAMMVSLIAEFR